LIGTPHNAMGGTVAAELLGQTGGPLPPIDYDALRRQMGFMLEAALRGAIVSAHAIGNGGLIAAAVKMCFASGSCIGASLDPARLPAGIGPVEMYLAESTGWLVEAIDALPENEALYVGETTPPDIEGAVEIRVGDIAFDVDDLHAAWSKPLAEVYP
jgi:phosphoribosylformylglycinamidine (FGAM) synthase-like enzyme